MKTDGLLCSRDAPMTVEGPSTLLAFFAAVFGAATSTTLSKLASVLLPLAALIVSTLSNASSSVILSTQISHDDTRPVLHIGAVIAHGELFDQREEVEIIR